MWKLFLGLGALDAATYLDFVRRGKSRNFDTIAKDVPRTFKSDAAFKAAVTEAKLVRVLSALDHWANDAALRVVRTTTQRSRDADWAR